MRPQILRPRRRDERATPERCRILEASNDADDPALSIARATVPQGVTTQWHSLRGTVERYLIVEGRGRVEVGGLEPALVRPGDVVRIPAGAPQRIRNTGRRPLVLWCLCTPRFRPENYVVRDDLESGAAASPVSPRRARPARRRRR